MKGEIKLNNYSYAYPVNRNPNVRTLVNDSIGGKVTALPAEPKLAMAYVPFQTTLTTYDEMKGLKAGTLFPCLNLPFLGSGTR